MGNDKHKIRSFSILYCVMQKLKREFKQNFEKELIEVHEEIDQIA